MRKTLLAAAALAAALVPGTAAAASTTLRAHPVAAPLKPVVLADPATMALQASIFGGQRSMVLRGDDGVTRTVAAPEGCVISGAGSGLVAGLCHRQDGGGDSLVELYVAGPDGVPIARPAVRVDADNANGYVALEPTAVGREWLAIPNGAKDSPSWTTVVNWHTGEVRNLYDIGRDQALDLDAPGLFAPLCAPIRRFAADASGFVTPFGVTARGRWVLLERGEGAFTLRRCGSAKPVALPKGFRPLALGDGWAAGATVGGGRAPRLTLVRLADRRRYAVTGAPAGAAVPGGFGWMLLTHGRLYATDGDRTGTVRLPGR